MSDDNDFLNDFYAFNSVNGDDNGQNSSGCNIGCGSGGIIIAIVVFLLISFLANGASVEAIETLLGLGFIAFIVVRFLFR